MSVLLAGSAAGAQSAQTAKLDAVIEAAGDALGVHAHAMPGGWHFSAAIETSGLHGTEQSWVDPAGGAEATYVQLPAFAQDTGYNGHAWTRDRKGVVVIDGSLAGRAAAINALYRDSYALWTHDRGGARVELSAPQSANGVTYAVVRVTPATSAAPFDYWFDSTTHVPARIVETIGPLTTTTMLADYQPANGLRVAFSQRSLDSQGNATALTLQHLDVDPSDLSAHVREPVSHVDDFAISGAQRTTVPFDLIDNHVYLNVMLNGRGPYRFIFDTGGRNIIDSAIAREIGATAVGQTQGGGVGAATEQLTATTFRSLRVGAAELRDQDFLVSPIRNGFAISASAPVDGIIGWEVLARFVTTFDYERHQITLQTSRPAVAAGQAIGFDFNGTQPELPCTIGAIVSVCTIDTGSRSSIDLFSPFLAAHPEVSPTHPTAVGVNGFGVGGGALGRLGRLPSLTIGGYELKDTIAGLSTETQGAFAGIGVGGNVGGGVLKRFTVIFDYPQQQISLVPNAAIAEPDVYDRSGLFAVTKTGQLIIADVRPQTPAALATLRKGDVITRIDALSGSELTLAALRDAFRAPAGTVLHLRVTSARSQTPRDVALILQDYI